MSLEWTRLQGRRCWYCRTFGAGIPLPPKVGSRVHLKIRLQPSNSTFEKLWASQACLVGPWGFNVEMIRFKSAAPFGLVAPGRLCQFPVKHLGFLCSEVAAPGARICEKHMNVNLGLPKSRNVALFRLTKRVRAPVAGAARGQGVLINVATPLCRETGMSQGSFEGLRLMTN